MAEVHLTGEPATAWAADLGRALAALRLNQHFPPADRVAAWIAAMATDGLRLDPHSGLPLPGAWARARVTRDLAPAALAELDGVDERRLPGPLAALLAGRRAGLAAAAALPALPLRDLEVALRHRDGRHASWLVRLDRLDLVSGTLARYTLIVADRPGRLVGAGELGVQATARLGQQLEVLSGQDAALAFAVLRDQEGLEVEEVVRGVIGPAILPGLAGPEVLRALLPAGLCLSACLERASLDVAGGRVDDPLAEAVVLPASGQPFGIARQRKWAAAPDAVPVLRGWLAGRESRNLVYPWSPSSWRAP